MTAPERVMVAVVIVAVAALEAWFFFFSGSPIDQRSGRGERPVQVAAVVAAPQETPGVTQIARLS